MQAIRIHQNPSATPFSAENPAPPSALVLDSDVPLPQISQPHEVLVRVRAASVTRDELTWLESYRSEYPILGHDFSGEIISIYPQDNSTHGDLATRFHPGDEVYGMTDATGRGSTWAEYAVVRVNEMALKPKHLDWVESASVPMSALTAWQALFDKAGLPPPDLQAVASANAKYSQS